MPVTKTAKRALRGSSEKHNVNTNIRAKLEAAIRVARKSKTVDKVTAAIKLADRAAKKKTIHKNKASHIKSALSKLISSKKVSSESKKTATKKLTVKKTSKAKK